VHFSAFQGVRQSDSDVAEPAVLHRQGTLEDCYVNLT
jgi:hypothetical protein